jgi:hypothetical protein
VPPGTNKLKAWHERLPALTQAVNVINAQTQAFLLERNKFCLGKPFSVRDFEKALHSVQLVS